MKKWFGLPVIALVLFLQGTAQQPVNDTSYKGQAFTDDRIYTRADSLRGMLTPERSCYDVLFYDLQVRVMPERKSVAGSNTIRFRVEQAFRRMQVDLFANLAIEKILYHHQALTYTRAYNAVFIDFPASFTKGAIDSITIYYHGEPRQPDFNTLQGGFFWVQDKNGSPWIESVCQGSGASLWWPCKDHLSDEPDSMHIAITIPDTLFNISNGTLRRVTALPGNLKQYDWYVHYPINNYNVAVNIGKYAYLRETYGKGKDTMPLHVYYLPYHAAIAQDVLRRTRRMLDLFEERFGPYPFRRDGFTVLESIYPMEHQSAVSIASFSNPPYGNQYDTLELERLNWHESAHEWWGNNVSCKDMADLWIHEAFATYAEIVAYEHFYGKEAALQYVREQVPGNKRPVIGRYDVNDFRLGDVYSKGARLLHTLQYVVNNDSLWFAVLRGIQQRFRYQTVTTNDIVNYFNKATKQNLAPIFDQYLRTAALPELVVRLTKKGKDLLVQYKWQTSVHEFRMPIRVTTTPGVYAFVYPTEKWQEILVTGMSPEAFQVDTDHFLVKVTKL